MLEFYKSPEQYDCTIYKLLAKSQQIKTKMYFKEDSFRTSVLFKERQSSFICEKLCFSSRGTSEKGHSLYVVLREKTRDNYQSYKFWPSPMY